MPALGTPPTLTTADRRPRRRPAVCVALLLFVVLAVSGCTNPEWAANAFVVHVVVPSCDHADTFEPLLVFEKSVGSYGKSSRTEWRSMRRLEGCGEPFEGRSWDGAALQVWVSDSVWKRSHPVRVQLGHKVSDADMWAIGDDDRMRIDHRHVFLGTIDVAAPGGVYVPPDGVDTAVAQLKDRQDCEGNTIGSCGFEWMQADLFTFDALPAPPVDTTKRPTLVVPH